MDFIEYTLLAVGTLSLSVATWRISLRARRYHGVYRFVSFESILMLFLLNWRFWFEDPFCVRQMFAWILLTASIAPVILGIRALRIHGQAQKQFENTLALVTTGIFYYIRHPMYLSLILLGTGVCLKNPTAIVIGLGVVNCAALVATALQEEKEMVKKFGQEYEAYMSRSRRFIPHVF